MTRKINLKDFEAAQVCPEGFKHFRAAFGEEIEVTEANCRRMAGLLNFNFGAGVFLKGRQAAAYFAVVGPAAEYAAKLMSESASEFERDLTSARFTTHNKEMYEQALQVALASREAREAPVRRAHEIKQAVEFARCYNLES